MLAGVTAAVRLLAGLAGLAAAAAHHRVILVVLVTVGAVAVTVATVTGVVGHLYIYVTLFTVTQKAKNLTRPYPEFAHQTLYHRYINALPSYRKIDKYPPGLLSPAHL